MQDQTQTMTNQSIEIQWSVYSEHYDNMCDANPSYQSMITLVMDKFAQVRTTECLKVADIGAGTGNLLAKLAVKYPEIEFTHVDMDLGMNKWAKSKYSELGASNIRIDQAEFLDWESGRAQYDVVLSTNALYAIQPHQAALAKMNDILKPNGHMILVDFGRKQNTNDWAWYIAKNSLKDKGLRATAKIFMENWEVARQNRRTKEAQESGLYWVHDTNEFMSELERSGFSIQEVSQCYRGYSDIAVCKKNA